MLREMCAAPSSAALTLDDARSKMEKWRKDYNNVRPHSAIGNKPPISLMKGSSAPSAA
ncbi:integrase core domain-containing protein [Stappia indica]|uniref:integrase core domain-containing protein n=1 Tax=Stappia indica TaxID=538381 RepID=UPI00384B408A